MKGFTIIEILVGIFILVIGITAVLNIFPLGLKMAKASQMASIATQLGQAKVEEAASDLYNNLVVGSTVEDYGSITSFESYKRETSINCVDNSGLTEVACDYDLVNDPDPMKKIEVTVFWRSSLLATEQSINLVSLIAKR